MGIKWTVSIRQIDLRVSKVLDKYNFFQKMPKTETTKFSLYFLANSFVFEKCREPPPNDDQSFCKFVCPLIRYHKTSENKIETLDQWPCLNKHFLVARVKPMTFYGIWWQMTHDIAWHVINYSNMGIKRTASNSSIKIWH